MKLSPQEGAYANLNVMHKDKKSLNSQKKECNPPDYNDLVAVGFLIKHLLDISEKMDFLNKKADKTKAINNFDICINKYCVEYSNKFNLILLNLAELIWLLACEQHRIFEYDFKDELVEPELSQNPD